MFDNYNYIRSCIMITRPARDRRCFSSTKLNIATEDKYRDTTARSMNVIAVDVGTTSVRLALISFSGQDYNEVNILASQEKKLNHTQDGLKFEQSSIEIWQAICDCCGVCMSRSKVPSNSIKSIAFSSTCSLVIEESPIQKSKNDIIMWMDHRAVDEAKEISSENSKVLKQFGGICSPEFSLSKLVWLKHNATERLINAVGLYELPDWLVQQCLRVDSSSSPRSLCSVVCKWGYDADQTCHCDLINSLNIQDKIGHLVLKPGTIAGYLSINAAKELRIVNADQDEKENLKHVEIVVGTSLIDAHSGMLAMLSVPLRSHGIELEMESTICSLAGTSSCHMLLSKHPRSTRGIWGPYKDVVLEDYYLLEAGQSLTGKLIDMCIESHTLGSQLIREGRTVKEIIHELNEQALVVSSNTSLHVLPTYHGNRSPLSNPRLRGGVYGYSAANQNSLLEHYIATVESIIYESRFIVETLGIKLKTILVSGGLMKNGLFMQTLADAFNCSVIKLSLKDVDFMVLGSGLIARQAALNLLNKTYNSDRIGGIPLRDSSINSMLVSQLSLKAYQPREERFPYHEKKYLCYQEFVKFSERVDKILHT